MRLIVACTLIGALAAAGFAATQERDYRARAFVIQVPSDMGGEAGLELARSDRVLESAIALSGLRGTSTTWLREHSRAEITSRLDLAFTVEAPDADTAAALATGYAKAFRRAIPDDRGLPVRGRGAGSAQPELGPLGWGALGALAGLALGVALTLIRNGIRSGSARGPRPASPASAPPT